jgi:hypothetical protein
MSKLFLPESKVMEVLELGSSNEGFVLLKEQVHHYEVKTNEELMNKEGDMAIAYFDAILAPIEITHIEKNEFSSLIGNNHEITV